MRQRLVTINALGIAIL